MWKSTFRHTFCLKCVTLLKVKVMSSICPCGFSLPQILHFCQSKFNIVLLQFLHMWHDQEECVGCRRYWFWDIGKKSCSNCFVLYFCYSIDKFFITWYQFKWFASKWNILRKWRKKLEIKIFQQVTHFLCHIHVCVFLKAKCMAPPSPEMTPLLWTPFDSIAWQCCL